MTDYAFSSTAACPLPPVPIIDVDLIKDCVVPDPADPIYEEPNIPMPVPPELDIGCPPIAISSSVRTNQDTARFQAWSQPKYDDGDNCFPQIFFAVDFPKSGGVGCFSIEHQGGGDVVTDIDRQIIDCETGDEDPDGNGIKLILHMGSQGSLSECEVTSSLGPEDRHEAVSSISSLTGEWEAFTGTCLHFNGLERLVYSGAEGKLFAYFRVFRFDATGRLQRIRKEKREYSYGVYPPLFQAVSDPDSNNKIYARRLYSNGSINPNDPAVEFFVLE